MKPVRASFVLFLFLFLLFPLEYADAGEVFKWNFKPAENNEPADTEPEYKELLQKYNGYFIGKPDNKTLYLTFDNGYEEGFTGDILDVLKEKDVPAAFFVTGHYLKSAPELVERMEDEGHIVGNHSWSHPSLPELSRDELKKELAKVNDTYQKQTGGRNMQYLRPPKGTFSDRTLAATEKLGYTNVFWSFAYVDWETGSQHGADHAYNSIMKRVHPGAVMLLHSVSEDNAEALAQVIDKCREEGYTFQNLDHLVLTSDGVLPSL